MAYPGDILLLHHDLVTQSKAGSTRERFHSTEETFGIPYSTINLYRINSEFFLNMLIASKHILEEEPIASL